MTTCFICSAVLNVAEESLIDHLLRRHPEARLIASLVAAAVTAAITPRQRVLAGATALMASAAILTNAYGSAT
jgi:hypothetical protein